MKVIGPIRAEEEQEKRESKNQKNSSSNNNKALVLGDKTYCPFDSSLMVYKPNLGCSLCKICGFTDGDQEPKSQESSSSMLPSIQRNMRNSDTTADSGTIGMNIIPIGEQGRHGILHRGEEETPDADTQALLDRGYTITDSQTVVNDQGTYNAEQALRERERFEERMSTRNRYSSWSVY